jgi:hypothetical protein
MEALQKEPGFDVGDVQSDAPGSFSGRPKPRLVARREQKRKEQNEYDS